MLSEATLDSPSLESVKSSLYSRNNPSLTPIDIEAHAETVYKILKLKVKHNVSMLGHNYMEPLVFGLSGHKERGDSLGLSIQASKTDSDYIIFNGVPFMAETAKIMNPEKTVLVADKSAGCSLADNFGAEEVKALKKQYPNVPVMIYINSYADAKAECDICCTSANAVEVAESVPGDEIIFVPDIYFAENLERELKGKKQVIYPGKNNSIKGAICKVHEQFTLEDILAIRKSFEIPRGHPNRMMYVHWECKLEVLEESDYYGSTGQIRRNIANRVKEGTLERAFIASECELTSNLAQEFPTVQFSTACSVRCSHMAKVSLYKILRILEAIDSGKDLSDWEVTLSPETISTARRPIERMLALSS